MPFLPRSSRYSYLSLLCVLLLLTACTGSIPAENQSQAGSQNSTINGPKNEPITYSTDSHDVLIRTFYGGGLYGSLSLGPQVSIYGDGTYILGLNRQGKLTTDALQQLLNTLVDTYGLLHLKRQQFSDIPDQNAAFLELYLNGKHSEFLYGAFVAQSASAQDMDEYQRLGKALTAITESLKGPVQPYHGTRYALLARQIFNPVHATPPYYWPLYDFTLDQVTAYECGALPPDDTSPNQESGCLKYTVPNQAVLLNDAQLQRLKPFLNNQLSGVFIEQGNYYEITLRPLLPDELVTKKLAMLGSAQSAYKDIPLHEGPLPPVTSTPAT
ncbi:MAG: hypothetical protein IMW89_12300 [Ktedonobacteraceae bacterium]|nr:hypothetical protein [Ktedonobacteraceae bacterium]